MENNSNLDKHKQERGEKQPNQRIQKEKLPRSFPLLPPSAKYGRLSIIIPFVSGNAKRVLEKIKSENSDTPEE